MYWVAVTSSPCVTPISILSKPAEAIRIFIKQDGVRRIKTAGHQALGAKGDRVEMQGKKQDKEK